MLNRLKAHARRNFLTVNTKKSVFVCFNSKTDNLPPPLFFNLPPLFYDSEVLPYSNTFCYLGMQLDKHISYLHNAAEEALKPCLAGMARILRTFAHQHQITHHLHAYLWLFKTYHTSDVIPAGMHASQIWATAYLQQGTEMDNCVQKWLLRFLRSMLGVRTSTPSWSVL
eukprot:1146442-Pelagomonas_calceolata.AAC.1